MKNKAEQQQKRSINVDFIIRSALRFSKKANNKRKGIKELDPYVAGLKASIPEDKFAKYFEKECWKTVKSETVLEKALRALDTIKSPTPEYVENIRGFYSAEAVSKYVVEYSDKISSPIDLTRLYSLMYFIQIRFLIKSKGASSCFDENLKVISYGVYLENIGLETLEINEKDRREYIDEDDKKEIELIINNFINTKTNRIVELIMLSTPFEKAKRQIGMLSVISNQEIMNWINNQKLYVEIESQYGTPEIAAFVINKSNSLGIDININRLQKTLFCVQEVFLKQSNGEIACFNDDFILSCDGPVIPELCSDYKHYGLVNIDDVTKMPPRKVLNSSDNRKVVKFSYESLEFREGMINLSDREMITAIIKELSMVPTENLHSVFIPSAAWDFFISKEHNGELIAKDLIFNVLCKD